MHRIVTENIGGDFGVTVIYRIATRGQVHCEFLAVQIVARGSGDDAPYYKRLGATSSDDHVTDPAVAQYLAKGSVKWDGCSHVYFGQADNSGYVHLCGRQSWLLFAEMLPKIYDRCGELMREDNVDLLDGEFPAS